VSTHSSEQKAWLVEKFALFIEHHDRKSLGVFFPPLGEEFFAKWPPAPTPEEIDAAGGKIDNAVATFRKAEEHVRGFFIPHMVSVLIKVIASESTDGCLTVFKRSTGSVGTVCWQV
jgi:hypothetical protein